MKRTSWSTRFCLTAFLFFSLFVIGAGAASAQSGIRSVDFQNFTYHPYCLGEEKLTFPVKDGKYEVKRGDDQFYFVAVAPEYGDVNGDGQEEAIIQTGCNTGGSGTFSEGFIYTMRRGQVVLLTNLAGGDRADGGFHRLSIQGGLVVVESYDHKTTSGACCPDFIDTQKFRWNGRRLVRVGRKTRRAYTAPASS
jgi:hypothetical protein